MRAAAGAHAPAVRTPAILVVGASGYVGGRLVPRLLDAGYRVRAAVRTPERLRERPWGGHPGLEIVAADARDEESLRRAADGTWAAYYLVHSMSARTVDFAEADRLGARNMAAAAGAAGLRRIIYLGGLGEDHPELSAHLRSRSEVDVILRSGPVPVTSLRAAMIIGSGSASFEILRYLVDRLPVMITPRWVSTPAQPIAITNVLEYLVGVLARPETSGETYDLGGPDILTYRRLMELYAEEAGVPRPRIVPVPVLTPRLSSYWIHLVTPVPAALARPLAEGLRNPVVCREDRIREVLPQDLLDARAAIGQAVGEVADDAVESHWRDAAGGLPAEWPTPGDPRWAGGTVYVDRRRVVADAAPEATWQHLVQNIGRRSGGETEPLRRGDVLGSWRVAIAEHPHRLSLVAEMRLPGRAWLEFEVRPVEDGRAEIVQTATFRPRGLLGILYWYALYPAHRLVVRGTLQGLARSAERAASRSARRSHKTRPISYRH